MIALLLSHLATLVVTLFALFAALGIFAFHTLYSLVAYTSGKRAGLRLPRFYGYHYTPV
jgi:hypothetical protein